MSLNVELLKQIGDFYIKIVAKDYSYLDFEQDYKEFIKLRSKVMEEYPGEPMFNKLIYHTSDFDKSYVQMRVACGEMSELIMKKGS